MKYVNWPPASTSGEFVIGVVGESKVHETLTKWYGAKSKGSQKIVIKEFANADAITDCHVLYIGKNKSGNLEGVLAKFAGKPTLIITDKTGLAKKGSGINFKTVNGKLKFEINQAAISNANLKISSQLTGMAILI
jgi:ribosomal protein L31